MRTVAFKTFGCRLNHAEAAQFEFGFAAAGFARVALEADADVVVVHSCMVTQKAENECVRLLRAVRKHNPNVCLVLSGCLAELARSEFLQDLGVDLVVPQPEKERLVPLVLSHLGLPRGPVPPRASPAQTTQRAVLKVQDGCDFFCTYCIVPLARGAPRSRPFETCLAEARALIGAGFNEIVVTGCNTACYRDGGRTLSDLLSALLDLPGLGRIRLGSIEPGTLEREIVALMARAPKLCRFLHLPLQSGDDRTLARMGRRYSAGEIAETLNEALRLMPDIGLGADIICGFPGETDEAFEHTRELIARFPLSKLHVFPYSERPGTPAAEFDGAVPLSERRRRTQLLIEQGLSNRRAFARRFLGKPVTFIPERFDANGCAHGWSGEYLGCVVSGVPRSLKRQLCAFEPDRADGELLRGAFAPSQGSSACTT